VKFYSRTSKPFMSVKHLVQLSSVFLHTVPMRKQNQSR